MERKSIVNKENIPIIIALTSTFFIVMGVSSPILTLIAFFLNIVYILYASSENIFYQLIFLMPFANIFKISYGSSSLFTYIELFVVAKIILSEKRIKKDFLLSWFLFFIYILLGFNGNYLMLIKQCTIPLIIYCFSIHCNPSFKKIFFYLTSSLIISSIIAMLRNYIPNMNTYLRSIKIYDITTSADSLRFTGLYSDPNYYSLALVLCIVAILAIFVYNNMSLKMIFPVVALVFLGSLTASKSFFLMLIIVVLAFLIFLLNKRKYNMFFWTILATILIVFLVFSGKLNIFQNTISRLQSGGDITTGRSEIWLNYINFFEKNALSAFFGSGVNAPYIGAAAHNTYIDFMYYYGFVGSILFVISCLCATNKMHFKRTVFNVMPILCICIMFFFLSSLASFDFPIILSITIFIFNFDYRKESII